MAFEAGFTKGVIAGLDVFIPRTDSDCLLEMPVVRKSSYLFLLSSSRDLILSSEKFYILSDYLCFKAWMFFKLSIFFIYFRFISFSSSSRLFYLYSCSLLSLCISSSSFFYSSFYFFCFFHRAIFAATYCVF